MSQNNLPTTMPTIEKLLARISAAERSQQKEIRITIQEARDLTIELSILTSKLGKTVQDIYKILQDLKDSNGSVEVKFDGGGW
jgi:hypothetical protein